MAKWINLGLLLLFGILRLRRLEFLPNFHLTPADVMRNPSSRRTGAHGLVAGDSADEEDEEIEDVHLRLGPLRLLSVVGARTEA
jgi:hypothetical protein